MNGARMEASIRQPADTPVPKGAQVGRHAIQLETGTMPENQDLPLRLDEIDALSNELIGEQK
jgi:hypothetical protein